MTKQPRRLACLVEPQRNWKQSLMPQTQAPEARQILDDLNQGKRSVESAFQNLPKSTPCDICQQEFPSKGAMKALAARCTPRRWSRKNFFAIAQRGAHVDGLAVPPPMGDSTSTAPLQIEETTASAWQTARLSEALCLDFGQKLYEDQNKLREQGIAAVKVWDKLGIPRETAYRLIRAYFDSAGFNPHVRYRGKTNADIINALITRIAQVSKSVDRIANDWDQMAGGRRRDGFVQQALTDAGAHFQNTVTRV